MGSMDVREGKRKAVDPRSSQVCSAVEQRTGSRREEQAVGPTPGAARLEETPAGRAPAAGPTCKTGAGGQRAPGRRRRGCLPASRAAAPPAAGRRPAQSRPSDARPAGSGRSVRRQRRPEPSRQNASLAGVHAPTPGCRCLCCAHAARERYPGQHGACRRAHDCQHLRQMDVQAVRAHLVLALRRGQVRPQPLRNKEGR